MASAATFFAPIPDPQSPIPNPCPPIPNRAPTHRFFQSLRCAILLVMTETERTHWEETFAHWGARLRGWGLDELAATLLEVAEPLAPVGAQALYVAQPALGLFWGRDEIGRLATLLEDPANLAWLRAHLTDPDADEDKTA